MYAIRSYYAFAERDQLREENAELSRARELLAAEKASYNFV